jgi:hypothetical protein
LVEAAERLFARLDGGVTREITDQPRYNNKLEHDVYDAIKAEQSLW